MAKNNLTENDGLFPSLWAGFFKGDGFAPESWQRGAFSNLPAVNVRENGSSYVVELAAPGFSKKDFQVEVEDGFLTISAHKEHQKREKRDKYTRKEFSSESFSRSFTLPENVLEGKIDAVYTSGMLQLTIPKKEKSKTVPKKTIEIT